MPKQRSPDSYKAEEMYKQGMKLVEIASQLNLPEGTVRRWKHTYSWDTERSDRQSERSHKKQGGQPGNKNAVGHGAPPRNKNAEKFGFFSKYLPEETVSIIQEMPTDPLDILWDQIQIAYAAIPPRNKNAEKFGFFSKYLPEETVSIIQEMPTDPLDILWDQIQIAYAAIIRAQQIMYVRDAEDKTVEKVEKKGGNVIGEKWEVQQAWDKQANFLSAQARAQKTLDGMINRYEDLLHKNWDLVTEEQKTRIEQMRANTERIRNLYSEDSGEDGVVIVNDAPASEDLGDHYSEVSADI